MDELNHYRHKWCTEDALSFSRPWHLILGS